MLAAEGWHPGRDRDRRLADRRAPPPARDPDRARRRGGQRLGPLDPRLRPARRPARERRAPAPLRRPQGRGGPDDRRARRSTRSARRSSSTPARCSRPRISCPQVRIDAVAQGDALSLDLAEELQQLAPFGMGNPAVSLLVPAATMSDPQRARRGPPRRVHAQRRRRPLALRRLRRRQLAPGRRRRARRRRGPAGDRPLERLGLAAAGPAPGPRRAARARSTCSASPRLRRRACCASSTATWTAPRAAGAGSRTVRDLRGTGHRRACSGTSSRQRRAGARRDRARAAPRPRARARAWAGSRSPRGPRWRTIRASPRRSRTSSSSTRRRGRCSHHPSGEGWTHLAWGTPELDFAVRIHEWDFNLREPLTAVYRALRAARVARGEAGETLLRGDGPQPRSAALAGRLVRVLTELGLVDLEREAPALEVAERPQRTALERSAAFRAYQRRFEDGQQYLTSSNPRRAAA